MEEGGKITAHEQLYRVEFSYFVCGLLEVNGCVSEAAPIMRLPLAQRIESVKQWIERTGGSLTLLR